MAPKLFQKTVTKSSNVPETGKQSRSNFFFVMIFYSNACGLFLVSYKKVSIASYDFMTIFRKAQTVQFFMGLFHLNSIERHILNILEIHGHSNFPGPGHINLTL